MYFRWFIEGLGIGLSIGLTCAVTCGPVVLVFILRRERKFINSLSTLSQILVGRLVGYVLFGVIFGAVGGVLSYNTRVITSYFAFMFLGMILVYYGIKGEEKEKCHKLRFSNLSRHPVLIGFFTGIEICPPFLLAIIRAGSLRGSVAGAVLFAGFFIGTSIFLLPIVFISSISNIKFFRTLAAVASIIIGIWFFGNGLFGAYKEILCKSQELASDEIIIGISDAKSIVIVSNDTWRDTLKYAISARLDTKIFACSTDSVFMILQGIEQTESTMVLWLEPGKININITNRFATILFDKEKSYHNLLQFTDFLRTFYFRKKIGEGFLFRY